MVGSFYSEYEYYSKQTYYSIRTPIFRDLYETMSAVLGEDRVHLPGKVYRNFFCIDGVWYVTVPNDKKCVVVNSPFYGSMEFSYAAPAEYILLCMRKMELEDKLEKMVRKR